MTEAQSFGLYERVRASEAADSDHKIAVSRGWEG